MLLIQIRIKKVIIIKIFNGFRKYRQNKRTWITKIFIDYTKNSFEECSFRLEIKKVEKFS